MNLYKIHKAFANPYQNHQALKNLFLGEGRVLFQNLGSSLLVLSQIKLSDEYRNNFLIDFLDIDNCLNGDIMNFSIRLNACKGSQGKRYTLKEDEFERWVDWKMGQAGVSLVKKSIHNEGVIVSDRQGGHCYHASLFVSGILKVEDRVLFSKSVELGIGHGKAFGFGLLNVFTC
jgi:CRISPR system Cascade subunit CasE